MKCDLLALPSKNISDQDKYLKSRYETFFAENFTAVQNKISVVREVPPIVPDKDHPQQPEIISAKIQDGEQCLLKTVSHHFKLSENETIISDTFSYLGAPYNGFPEDTVVLTRITSMCQFFFIFQKSSFMIENRIYRWCR